MLACAGRIRACKGLMRVLCVGFSGRLRYTSVVKRAQGSQQGE